MKYIVRNNYTQLQVLTLKSGEILPLMPRASATIPADEIGPDVDIKAKVGSITLIKVSEPAVS